MIVDTDVIIRFLTNDDSKKAKSFEHFLNSKQKIILTDVGFAEIYWTLKSFYKFPKGKIIPALNSIISFPSIASNKPLLSQTLNILQNHNISLIDAYNAAYSLINSDSKILSFDKGFDKISPITRQEP